MLKNGDVDLITGISLDPVEDTKIVAAHSVRQLYIAANDKDKALVEELDDAIMHLNQIDPFYQQSLFSKYFEEDCDNSFNLTGTQRLYVTTRAPVKIIFQNEAPPFQYTDNHGNVSGVSVKVLDEISKLTGLKFEIVQLKNGTSLKQAVQENQADMVMATPYRYDIALEYGFIHSQPFIEAHGETIYNKHSIASKPFSGMELVLPKGSTLRPDFSPKNIRYLNTVEACLKEVNDGNADFTIVNDLTFSYYNMQRPYFNLYIADNQYEPVNYAFSFCVPIDAELATIVNNAIRSIDTDKIYDYSAEITISDTSSTLWGIFLENPLQITIAIFCVVIFIVVTAMFIVSYRLLRNKNIVLKQAYAVKSDFLSNISHEIRTPLNAILGFSSLGLQETKENTTKSYLNNIQTSGQYLLGIINDVLDMARIEKSEISFFPTEVNLKDFISEISSILKDSANSKNINLTFACKNINDDYAIFDKLRMQQIFINLISNAIKYSHVGGNVTCTIEKISVDDYIVNSKITIQDFGVGMSQEFLLHIYEPFTQEKNQYTNSLNSSGLGLPIVYNLVKGMEWHHRGGKPVGSRHNLYNFYSGKGISKLRQKRSCFERSFHRKIYKQKDTSVRRPPAKYQNFKKTFRGKWFYR